MRKLWPQLRLHCSCKQLKNLDVVVKIMVAHCFLKTLDLLLCYSHLFLFDGVELPDSVF